MRIEITGKRALFARPELRAERVSYEIPPVSAAIGILRCIFWHPQMDFRISKIYSLKKPHYESMTTHALTRKGVVKTGRAISYGSIVKTPRSMLILKDVHYIIEFTIRANGLGKRPDDSTAKFCGEFARRARKGACFCEPSLGAREFSCDFRLMDDDEEIPVSENRGVKPLGRMLHHVEFSDGKVMPIFYNPVMRDGVVDVNESLEGYCSQGWLFQNLVGFYDSMKEKYQFPAFGFSNAKILFEITLSRKGEFLKFAPIRISSKGKVMPVTFPVPNAAIRTTNIAPNFLWDNGTYVLGNGKSGTIRKKAFIEQIKDVMDGASDPGVDAVLAFLENTDNASVFAQTEPYLSGAEKIVAGNIVFRIDSEDQFVHDSPVAKERWERYFHSHLSGVQGECIITGAQDYITQVHPMINGFKGCSGLSRLVSIEWQTTAFEYYNLKQMENSPFGLLTTHKYATVLNWMLSTSDHKVDSSDETFVFWSENDNPALLKALQKALGKPVDDEICFDDIPYGERFYIVGIKSATKGRAYIAHYQDFVYGDDSKQDMKVFLAAISGHFKSWKPCYTILNRWESNDTMDTAENSGNIKSKGHLLGELLACIEKAQRDAVPGVRKPGARTIADRYMEQASQTPVAAFPEMLRMATTYTSSVDYGMRRKIAGLLAALNSYPDPFPMRLALAEQCEFFAGYYEMTDSFFQKKDNPDQEVSDAESSPNENE